MKRVWYSILVGVALAAANARGAELYYGGDILTLAGAEPEYVEALVVDEGRIAFAGELDQARERAGAGATARDLQGRFLMPGFIDAHGHFMLTAAKLSTVALDPPPAGIVTSIGDIVKALKQELDARPRSGDQWLFGWGFDNGMLAEGRFPTRRDLDAVSTEVPVVLIHFSGHMLVMNSAGLKRAGYSADYQPPSGGAIQREADGSPNGVIEETAMFQAFQVMTRDVIGPQAKVSFGVPMTRQDKLGYMERAQAIYLREGFTTMAEMAGSGGDLDVMAEMAGSGKLVADLVLFLHNNSADAQAVKQAYSPNYQWHFRVGGAKVNLDGGSPGRTAFLREPYHTPTPGKPAGYRGYPAIPDQEELNHMVASYYQARVPMAIHALGDAAIDQAIEAVSHGEKAAGYDDIRTQLIHLQVINDDQFEALEELDVTLTFQNTHNFYFADFHNSHTLGPERTRRLTPMKTAFERGFSTTFHHDSPVHPVSQLMLIWIATNREGRSGVVYGPEERISTYQALRAATIEGAWQFREEKHKGSLEAGKLADMVVLDRNPLKMDTGDLRQLRVLETIKEGETVFRLPDSP